jgi:hypothetical protein
VINLDELMMLSIHRVIEPMDAHETIIRPALTYGVTDLWSGSFSEQVALAYGQFRSALIPHDDKTAQQEASE